MLVDIKLDTNNINDIVTMEKILAALRGSRSELFDLDSEDVDSFMNGFSPRSRGVLRLIAKSRTGRMKESIIREKLELDRKGVGHALRIITKRARAKFKDPEGHLVKWDANTAEYDEDKNLVECHYYVSKTTLGSLKEHFTKKEGVVDN